MVSFNIAVSCYHLLRLLGSVETDTLGRAVEVILLRFIILGEIPLIGVRIPFEAFIVTGVLIAVYFVTNKLFHDPVAHLRKQV